MNYIYNLLREWREREREKKWREQKIGKERLEEETNWASEVSKDCLNASLHHSENGNFLSCFL